MSQEKREFVVVDDDSDQDTKMQNNKTDYVENGENHPNKKPRIDSGNGDSKVASASNKENQDPNALLTTPKSSPPKSSPKSSKDKPKRSKEELEAEKRQKEEAKAAREQERKLKQQKREEERLQKEEERKQREEEKKRREEEKEEERKQREEEKKRREEEKEAKRKEKEEANRKKEEEKEAKRKEKEDAIRKKEEEKAAKEKAQKRIGSFFTVKKKSVTPEPQQQQGASDFEQVFLPFHVKPNMQMHSGPLYECHQDSTPSNATIDDWIKSQTKIHGYLPPHSASEVAEMINLEQKGEEECLEYIKQLPRKHLQFAEDFRPPYVGTWSKPCDFSTEPFTRISTINYDHDSEAEYESEGEDIEESDDENSESEDPVVDEEMQDFLDDSEDMSSPKRGHPVSKVPVIKWNDGGEESKDIFGKFCLEFCVAISGPIDPFYDYWGTSKPSAASADDRPLPLTIQQLNDIITFINGSLDPKGIVIHNVCQHLEQKVAKKTVENVMARCMQKVARLDPATKKSTKAWTVIESKLENECKLIDSI